VADDVAVLHHRGLRSDLVARVVDGAKENLHALRAEASFFVRVPPTTTFIYIILVLLIEDSRLHIKSPNNSI
jgi:hypothetical protein